MKKAKPHAAIVLSNMAAGSLYAVAAINVYHSDLTKQQCETLAILLVGLLLQFVAVLNRKKLEATLLCTCFVTTFASLMAAKHIFITVPMIVYSAGTMLALFLCDRAIKKLT